MSTVINEKYRSRSSARVPVRIDFKDDPGRAKQSMRDECDINRIMAKYQKTGVIAHVNKHSGVYADVQPIEYQEAMNTLIAADRMFAELPATARKRFHNDPVEFLTFVQDPQNIEEMRKLGLAKPGKPAAPATAGAEGAQPGAEPAGDGAGGV